MAPRRAVSVGPILGLLVMGGAIAAGSTWVASMQQLERTVARKRAALKPLQLPGRIPPNQEVHDYLVKRTAALEARYRALLERVGSGAASTESRTNPQLFFQERVHDMQRTLERLATARSADPPEQLGLPKELPPPDVVPRLLVQLDLIQQGSELIMSQGNAHLLSVKLEDPELMPPPADEQPAFLMRLPVRFRFECSLPAVTKILGIVERAKPFIDVEGLSLRRPEADGTDTAAGDKGADKGKSDPAKSETGKADTGKSILEAELVLARYLVTAPELPSAGEEGESEKGAQPAKKSAHRKGTEE